MELKLMIVSFIRNILFTAFCEMIFDFKKRNMTSSIKLLIYNSVFSIPLCIINIIIAEESNYFFEFYDDNNDFKPLIFFLVASAFLVMITNCLFFTSIEKNTPLVTQIFNDSKINAVNYYVLKNSLEPPKKDSKEMIGICLSFLGHIVGYIVSLVKNIKVKDMDVLEEDVIDEDEDDDKAQVKVNTLDQSQLGVNSNIGSSNDF